MRCAYFDCFAGAAGDMILGALVDAGWPLAALQDVVARLRLPGVQVSAARVQRGGLAATHVQVHLPAGARAPHRHLPDILALIADAGLPGAAARRAAAVFTRLAQAEAAVHGIAPEQVHFHEVGAADALVDIVGTCAAVAQLGLDTIACSPVPTGSGTVACEHGLLPVPAPATAELLRGVPLAECPEPAELTTPTGAALLTTLASAFGPLPAMRIDAIGYGAGTRENRTRPNLLRIFLGQPATPPATEQDLVSVLEAQVDDATGQAVAHACERLREAGALDVFVVPIIMKKGRPGQLLSALCRPPDRAALEAVLFRETPTFGVRHHECVRSVLAREQVDVNTRFGPVRVKVGRRGGQVLQAWPEYEDCAAAARRHGVALRDVQDEALRQWAQHADARDAGGDR